MSNVNCLFCGKSVESKVIENKRYLHCPECGAYALAEKVEGKEQAVPRPPFGCAPWYIRIPDRIKELACAIERNAGDDGGMQITWAEEIIQLTIAMKNLRKGEANKSPGVMP